MHKTDAAQLPVFSGANPALAHSKESIYAGYYRTLIELREEFHRTGRYDDSNTKLDEIVKLLVMRLHEHGRALSGGQDRFDQEFLRASAASRFGSAAKVAQALRSLSEEVLSSERYRNPDGTSVFGAHPHLNIQPTDDAFAARIVDAVRALIPTTDGHPLSPIEFDVINESFGHFVRDSFRNHIEDAQYMTPPEVVAAMVEIAFGDIEVDPEARKRLLNPAGRDPFVVVDPTCGVGSFLVEALRKMLRFVAGTGSTEGQVATAAEAYRDHCIYGQDKVDRMVRLSKLNLMLFGGGGGTVVQGNSIIGESILDELQGRVDLILTNPPFGARYPLEDVLTIRTTRLYPTLQRIAQSDVLAHSTALLDSEVLLLDRCLSLLRPGGRLVIVLPDSVVSGRGLHAAIRQAVGDLADLLAVVELPAETFAQAGTRTKTCFLYLQKRKATAPDLKPRVFMGVCDDLGYRVVARSGASVKITNGSNELPALTAAYLQSRHHRKDSRAESVVVSREPSAVWVPERALLNGRWTPNFYRARRLDALKRLGNLSEDGFDLQPLSAVATLSSRSRRRRSVPKEARTVSVLHVGADGVISFREVEVYTPKFQGLPCRAGDVLISKINPRIPRVCVVPETTYPLACSTEFEILEPKAGMDPHLLAAILVSPVVQTQIECLTSGTSSSHNRIKDVELEQVLIPLPRNGSDLSKRLADIGARLRDALEQKYAADRRYWTGVSMLADLLRKDDADANSAFRSRKGEP